MNNPLTPADVKACQKGMYECRRAIQEIEANKACGLECAEEEVRATTLLDFFTKVLERHNAGRRVEEGS